MSGATFDFDRAWAGGESEPVEALAAPLPVVTLAEAQERPVEWMVRGLVPLGALTLIVGPGGVGKTCFGVYLGGRLTRGQPIFPGLPAAEPADVLIVSAEDSIERVLLPRARLAGADLARFHAVDLGEADLALPDDADALRAAVERYGARLVIVDPISAFLGGRIDSHRDASLRGALRPLHALAEATGAAVLGVVHPNKSRSTDVTAATSGSAAWVNAARSALVFGRKPDAPETDPTRIVAVGKSNYGPLGAAHELVLRVPAGEAHPAIAYVGPSGVTSAELLAGADPDGRLDREDAEEFLRAALAEGEWREARPVKDAARREGIGEKPLRVARERLGVETRRQGSGRDGSLRSEWRLVYSCPPPCETEGTSNEGTSKHPHDEADPGQDERYSCPGSQMGTSNGSPPPANDYGARFRERQVPLFGPPGQGSPNGPPDPLDLLAAAGLGPAEEPVPDPAEVVREELAAGDGWAVAVERDHGRRAGGGGS